MKESHKKPVSDSSSESSSEDDRENLTAAMSKARLKCLKQVRKLTSFSNTKTEESSSSEEETPVKKLPAKPINALKTKIKQEQSDSDFDKVFPPSQRKFSIDPSFSNAFSSTQIPQNESSDSEDDVRNPKKKISKKLSPIKASIVRGNMKKTDLEHHSEERQIRKSIHVNKKPKNSDKPKINDVSPRMTAAEYFKQEKFKHTKSDSESSDSVHTQSTIVRNKTRPIKKEKSDEESDLDSESDVIKHLVTIPTPRKKSKESDEDSESETIYSSKTMNIKNNDSLRHNPLGQKVEKPSSSDEDTESEKEARSKKAEDSSSETSEEEVNKVKQPSSVSKINMKREIKKEEDSSDDESSEDESEVRPKSKTKIVYENLDSGEFEVFKPVVKQEIKTIDKKSKQTPKTNKKRNSSSEEESSDSEEERLKSRTQLSKDSDSSESEKESKQEIKTVGKKTKPTGRLKQPVETEKKKISSEESSDDQEETSKSKIQLSKESDSDEYEEKSRQEIKTINKKTKPTGKLQQSVKAEKKKSSSEESSDDQEETSKLKIQLSKESDSDEYEEKSRQEIKTINEKNKPTGKLKQSVKAEKKKSSSEESSDSQEETSKLKTQVSKDSDSDEYEEESKQEAKQKTSSSEESSDSQEQTLKSKIQVSKNFNSDGFEKKLKKEIKTFNKNVQPSEKLKESVKAKEISKSNVQVSNYLDESKVESRQEIKTISKKAKPTGKIKQSIQVKKKETSSEESSDDQEEILRTKMQVSRDSDSDEYENKSIQLKPDIKKNSKKQKSPKQAMQTEIMGKQRNEQISLRNDEEISKLTSSKKKSFKKLSNIPDSGLEGFHTSNPHLESTDDGTVFTMQNLKEDDEIWFMRCPKTLLPLYLIGQKIDFDNSKKLQVDGVKYGYSSYKTNSKLCLLASKSENSPTLSTKVIQPAGNIMVYQLLKSKTPEIQNLENSPSNSKTSHPLFGKDFKEEMKFVEALKNRLLQAEIERREVIEKAMRKKESKPLELQREREDKQDEMILQLLDQAAINMSKKRKKRVIESDSDVINKKIRVGKTDSDIQDQDSSNLLDQTVGKSLEKNFKKKHTSHKNLNVLEDSNISRKTKKKNDSSTSRLNQSTDKINKLFEKKNKSLEKANKKFLDQESRLARIDKTIDEVIQKARYESDTILDKSQKIEKNVRKGKTKKSDEKIEKEIKKGNMDDTNTVVKVLKTNSPIKISKKKTKEKILEDDKHSSEVGLEKIQIKEQPEDSSTSKNKTKHNLSTSKLDESTDKMNKLFEKKNKSLEKANKKFLDQETRLASVDKTIDRVIKKARKYELDTRLDKNAKIKKEASKDYETEKSEERVEMKIKKEKVDGNTNTSVENLLQVNDTPRKKSKKKSKESILEDDRHSSEVGLEAIKIKEEPHIDHPKKKKRKKDKSANLSLTESEEITDLIHKTKEKKKKMKRSVDQSIS